VAILRWKDPDFRFVSVGVLIWLTFVSAAFAAIGGAFPLRLLTGFFSNPYIFIHLGVLLELFFFSLALSYRYKQHILKRQQAEWALSDLRQAHQREMERISRDLHDEIGSTLSSISILGDSTLQHLPSNMNQARLAAISERARQVMDTMSDIVWSVNPRNDTMAKVVQRMKEFAVEILESQGITLHFEADEAVGALKLPMEKRKDFYLLYKEAVNNAAKYSRASEVRVLVGAENGALSLEVRDNGRGFDLALVKPGNGLWNMQQRAERMRGRLELESAVGGGTRISLLIN
jgi:signal transduction histidine kinase